MFSRTSVGTEVPKGQCHCLLSTLIVNLFVLVLVVSFGDDDDGTSADRIQLSFCNTQGVEA